MSIYFIFIIYRLRESNEEVSSSVKKKLLKYFQKLLENYLSQNYLPTADDISKGYYISTTGIATYHKDDAKVIKHITLVYKSKKKMNKTTPFLPHTHTKDNCKL